MNTNSMSQFRTAVSSMTLCLLVGAGALFAQEPAAPPAPDNQQQAAPANGGWRRVEGQANAQSQQSVPPAEATVPAPAPEQETIPADAPPPAAPAPAAQSAPPEQSAPRATMDPNYAGAPPAQYPSQPYPQYPNQQYPNQQYPNQYPGQPYPNQQPPYAGQGYGNQPPPANYNRGPIPAKLTIKPGTYITVRLSQGLSSDRNHDGDPFAATLAAPLIVDGVVIANRGQTLGGKVIEAKKAGRVQGVSHLRVQLTDVTLSDGQPVPIQTQLITKNGPTSVGNDVGAVGATTAAGAAIGAAADWGRGAAIGAGAGALVGIVGVLVTRGRPTYLYPEQLLTFRVEAPVTVSTETAPQAFRWAGPYDYERPYNAQNRMRPRYPYAYPYAYAYPYPYYGYPYYWGPSLYIGGWWGGRWRR